MCGYGERERAEVSAMYRGGEVHGRVMVPHEIGGVYAVESGMFTQGNLDDCVDLRSSIPIPSS